MPINRRTVRGGRLALGSVWFDTAFRSPSAMRGGQFDSPGFSHLAKSGVYHHQSGNVLQGERAYELSIAQEGRGLASVLYQNLERPLKWLLGMKRAATGS